MKMKAVLKSLLIAYGITGVFLLFLALALFSFDLSEKAVRAGILAAYILACLTGGYGAGKMLRKEKYLWGLLVGSCYFFLLLMVSVLAGWETRYDRNYDHYVFSVPGRRNSWRDVVLTCSGQLKNLIKKRHFKMYESIAILTREFT